MLVLRALGQLLRWRVPHTHIQSRASSRDSSGSEEMSLSGVCVRESSGFGGDTWVCESWPSHDGVNASSGAAGFTKLELKVQELGA